VRGVSLVPKVTRADAFVSKQQHGTVRHGGVVFCRPSLSGTIDWTVETGCADVLGYIGRGCPCCCCWLQLLFALS
jgi:hypothetical protein